MRTTLTLDDDVAAKLKEQARRTGKPFKVLVNETLRLGMVARRAAKPAKAYRVTPFKGGLRPGFSLDNVSELLEQADGAGHR